MTTGGRVEAVSFGDLSAQLAQGVNLYEIIGKLYVEVQAKNQALGLAAQAIQNLLPKKPEGEEPAGAMTPADLPPDAPDGTVVIIGGPEHIPEHKHIEPIEKAPEAIAAVPFGGRADGPHPKPRKRSKR